VLSTTVGETAADFLDTNLSLGLTTTTLVMAALLAGALLAQFRAARYLPAIYWVAVVLISIVGTLITDILSDSYNVPLEVTMAIFAAALAITFRIWYRTERTLLAEAPEVPTQARTTSATGRASGIGGTPLEVSGLFPSGPGSPGLC
jgi:uncharacterized membrane-anchored protein